MKPLQSLRLLRPVDPSFLEGPPELLRVVVIAAAHSPRDLHAFLRHTGLVTLLVPVVVFLAAPLVFLAAPLVFLAAPLVFLVVFLAAPVVSLVTPLVALLAVEAALSPVSTGLGGNHTTLVALAFATNEAPRAAHFSLSVTLFHRLFISIICCSLP